MSVGRDWRANAADADGHAFPSTGRGNAICGEPWFDPKFAYPAMFRCDKCRQKVEEERQEKKHRVARLGTARMNNG